MSKTPTGTVVKTDGGADLVITRVFRGTLHDVWESVTSPEGTARWIGPWRATSPGGPVGVGHQVTLTMNVEEGAPETPVHIDACEPPHRVSVSTHDAMGVWRLEARLKDLGGERVELTFLQHVEDAAILADTGPGWEFYLDRLVAARDGVEAAAFSAYHPSQRPHYQGLIDKLTSG